MGIKNRFSIHLKWFGVFFLTLLFNWSIRAQPNFTLQVATGLETGGSKEGGAVWADFDNDGDLDLLVNTDDGSIDSRLYRSDGAANPSFSDVTATLADGLLDRTAGRSILWGDLNNDGNIDFVRNDFNDFEIYINRGSPNFEFGVGAGQTPNLRFTDLQGVINMEGVGLLDYNNDGWMDLVLENANGGIDILENRQQDATATINITFNDGGDNDGVVENDTEATVNNFFRQVTVTGNTLGLPTGGGNGDYLAVGDYNADGFVDLLVRKPTGTDKLWTNDGDGTFTANTSVPDDASTDADNGNKGGVIFCDFDLDGDLDFYWTDGGDNQVWLQTTAGTFTATSKPTIPDAGPNIDGCACADVDLDGDIDLLVGNDGGGGGDSYLFLNNTTTPNSVAGLSFGSRIDIAVNANAEGVNLVDYDSDGDYDIYFNIDGGNNQLWESDFCDMGCNFLEIFIEDCLDGTPVTRPVVGATIILKDDMGNIISAAQSGSTAAGHGAQNPPSSIFGLPDMVSDYTLDITFPEKNGVIETFSFDFNAADVVDNTLVLTALEGTDGSSCSFSVLPVVLSSFTGRNENGEVILDWTTVTEINNDLFEVEKSSDALHWETIGTVQGHGNSTREIFYQYIDPNPFIGINYYRLKQIDFDGAFEYYPVIFVAFESESDGFEVFPNPSASILKMRLGNPFRRTPITATLTDMNGKTIWVNTFPPTEADIVLYIDHLDQGTYLLKLKNKTFQMTRRVLIH